MFFMKYYYSMKIPKCGSHCRASQGSRGSRPEAHFSWEAASGSRFWRQRVVKFIFISYFQDSIPTKMMNET